MKYKNGTIVIIDKDRVSDDMTLANAEYAIKTGFKTYLYFSREDATEGYAEEGVNKLFDRIGDVYSPEFVGLTVPPYQHSKDQFSVAGDILYVSTKYYSELFGFEPTNVFKSDYYEDTTPVLLINEKEVMLLDNSGIVTTLPVKTEKLTKHSPLWVPYNVNNFAVSNVAMGTI